MAMGERVVDGYKPRPYHGATLEGRTTCMNRTKTPCQFRTKVLIYAVLATRFVILSPDGIRTKNLTPLRTGSAKNPETLRLGCAQAQGDIERRLVRVR